ncbi:pyruvate dehydrogenase [Planomonospora parontospora subsp. parontospora]|uniref:Pyruvate dehydrogenase n=2 Tax=Planomonospora parontospora TaxID=58119 RepID=A0AA37F480_9ACTN|nr:transketolase C-terminal domain-containing protein [Planomonospora parontospora]GGK63060.1 pyruvate dehydrogenase [Planomonospora parontospora]GII08257.1 pyruvate dehydrogenase [Planomonospora parontospora subsp. parontospora]
MTRVAEHLNRALHDLLAADPDVHVLGEDIADPYGGAFKVTRGLSDRFGERVRSTPLSEGAIVGVGAGLALAGEKAVVEIMFADFAALAFDQLVNFAAKSTTMYGRPVPIPLVVRCPSGGGRGYGPTHSQSPQKHFLGVPGLHLFELTPFHDAGDLLAAMFALGQPCLLFEDKVLYTRRMFTGGVVDDLFRYELTGGTDGADGTGGTARVFVEGGGEPDCTLVVPGGLAHRALAAARELLLEEDLLCELLVPARLYPVPELPGLERARHVCVAEDGSEGGTWGTEVARVLYPRLWPALRRPITLLSAAASVIPAAPHLEREVLLQPDHIKRAITEALS